MHINSKIILVGFTGLFFISGLMAQDTTWTLESCINYALNENIQVKQAQLVNQQSELNFERAKAAKMPSAQASISDNLSWNKSYDNTSGTYGSFESSNRTNYSVSSNVTVFNGMRITNQIKQSALDLKSNQFYTDVVKESVELSILDGYLQVLYAQEKVTDAAKQIEATNEQLSLAEERLALSAISQSDYLQIKSELANEKLTLANTQSQLILAKVNLEQLMELPVKDTFNISSPNLTDMLNENRIPDAGAIFTQAVGVKPQVKQAEMKEESAKYDEKIARADLYPSFSVNAGIGTSYTVSNDNYSYVEMLSNNVGPYLGFSLAIPIYQKKQVKTSIGLAKIGMEQAALNTQNTKNTLRKEVEQAAANVLVAQQQYLASAESFNVATESLKIANEKFNLGLLNSVDFLFEKTSYIVSESNYLQNKYKLIFSYKVLDFYKGVPLTL